MRRLIRKKSCESGDPTRLWETGSPNDEEGRSLEGRDLVLFFPFFYSRGLSLAPNMGTLTYSREPGTTILHNR